MRRFTVVTVLTAAFAFAALATGALAHPSWGIAADGRVLKLAPAGRASVLASSANDGDANTNVVRYESPYRRRGRGVVYALMGAAVFALLLIALAIWKKIRSRAHELT